MDIFISFIFLYYHATTNHKRAWQIIKQSKKFWIALRARLERARGIFQQKNIRAIQNSLDLLHGSLFIQTVVSFMLEKKKHRRDTMKRLAVFLKKVVRAVLRAIVPEPIPYKR